MLGGLPKGVKVVGRSRLVIRGIAYRIRGLLDLRNPDVDMVRLLEHRLTELGGTYHIASFDELGDNEAVTFPDISEIHLREDVYNALCAGDHRARFTVAHEFGHLVLHQGISLGRNKQPGGHQHFEDSEWQADCFASEFLMPARMVAKDFTTASAISKAFNVSLEAAMVRIRVLQAEGLMRRS